MTVALTPGTDTGTVVAEITRLAEPAGGLFIQDQTASYAEVRRSIQPQVTALWLFAGAAAAATMLVVAQLLGRQLRQSATHVDAGLALARGLPPPGAGPRGRARPGHRPRRRSSRRSPSRLLLSGRFPIGPARLAETDRGTEVHAWLHLGGAAAVVLAALAIGVVAAFLGTPTRPRPARLGWLARAGAGASRPAVVVGVHLATGAGRGKSAVPVRSAAAGVALAVAAVFATVTCRPGPQRPGLRARALRTRLGPDGGR